MRTTYREFRGFDFLTSCIDCAKNPPNHRRPHSMSQTTTKIDGMQPPCPPQHIFSAYVSWPVSRYSVPIIPETDENRLSAHVTSRPRPPRRLQSERLNNNRPQEMYGKGTKRRPLVYPVALYARGRSLVPAWKVMEAK